jgi:hypothetical protein
MRAGAVRDRILLSQGKDEGEEPAASATDEGDEGSRPIGKPPYASVHAVVFVGHQWARK